MSDPLNTAADYPGSNADQRWRRLVAPADYVNPAPKPRYHLVVVGAGPAGLVTAIAAAGLGARVALVERGLMGGDCLNVGCMPSKALLEFSRRPGASFDRAFEWLRLVRSEVAQHDSVERYTQAGVDVFLGTARFVSGTTLAVGDAELVFRRAVIATGARAALPSIPGLATVQALTNETVFDLRSQPARLAILGAGPIGCELAQAFARLGTEVHLLEAAANVLAAEMPAASDAVAAALRAAGVQLELGAGVTGVERLGNQIVVRAGGASLKADALLVAAGRRPNTDLLNLAAVGVQTDVDGRVVVDDYLRTTNRRIFAAGDVCSRLQFTHHADAQARIVVQNALFLPTAKTRSLVIPHCTYTEPEVAQVGARAAELTEAGRKFDRLRIDHAELDRGRAAGVGEGFVEVLLEPGKGKLLGATVVGRDAGELIAPICMAMSLGLGIEAFGRTVLPYPTRSEALKRLADQRNRGRLTPAAQRWLARWFRWTR